MAIGSRTPRKSREPLDQQTNFMSTKTEKERLLEFCDELGMSISQACRYLVKKGLAAHYGTTREGE